MKKDIKPPKVEDVSVAVVEEKGEHQEAVLNVYLINQKNKTLEGVMVSSKGYGRNVNTEEKVETTMLRHFLDRVEPESFKKIEPIMDDVLGLNNEYWVSFFLDGKMYDKKFIFVAESITDKNFQTVPLIQKSGVLIQ